MSALRPPYALNLSLKLSTFLSLSLRASAVVDLSLTVDLSHLSVGRADFMGGGGSTLFVISWVWVDFMV